MLTERILSHLPPWKECSELYIFQLIGFFHECEIDYAICTTVRACCSVVGWGTILQAGRSQIWLGLWQKWVPGTFLGVEGGRRVGLTTLPPSTSRSSGKCESLDVSQPCGLQRPATGIVLPLPLLARQCHKFRKTDNNWLKISYSYSYSYSAFWAIYDIRRLKFHLLKI
jgi:hypothetical protein